MSTLRERCKQIADKLMQDAMLRQGYAVDTILEFVIAETGRKADKSLEKTLPLCVYFQSDKDREEFIAAIYDAKPGMVARKMP